MEINKMPGLYKLLLEYDKLKAVYRTTLADVERRETSAEHSWSVAMIIMTLYEKLNHEFPGLDQLKSIQLGLIHDVVEIYAGDTLVFDQEARNNKYQIEVESLEKLKALSPEFADSLHQHWYDFEANESIEAKVAKAADAISPIIQRLNSKQGYQSIGVNLAKLNQVKLPHFIFSKTYSELYQQLVSDLLSSQLIDS